jgi:cell division protease FtsH
VTLLILLVANILISNLLFQPSQPKSVNISYTEFKRQVTAGNVSSITAIGNSVTGSTHQPVKDINGKDSATRFATEIPVFAGSGLEGLLDSHEVIQYARPNSDQTPLWLTLLFNIGPTILLVGLFLYISRRAASAGAGGILGQFGQSRARLYDQERPTTTFADVAGIDEVKGELQEVVDFLRDPQKYQRLGGTMPKGVLLVGAPGTGKTLLARAVAGEAGVPFFSQ